jgi:small GTP-binding protein
MVIDDRGVFMSKVTDLLKAALEKQKKRFFLSAQEKHFLSDVESMLTKEDLSEIQIIHNVRIKLNLLIDQPNRSGKNYRMLEDLIPVILQCKIEFIRNSFNDVDISSVEALLHKKKFADANKLLLSIVKNTVTNSLFYEARPDDVSILLRQLFFNENDIPYLVLDSIFTYLAREQEFKGTVSKDIVSASLVCKQWNHIIMSDASFSKIVKNFKEEQLIENKFKEWFKRNPLMKPYLKIVNAGADSPGCTSCVVRYTQDEFVSHPATIGVTFHIKPLVIYGQHCKLQLWDIAGQDRFRSVINIDFRGADGVILFFELSRRSTFDRLSERILEAQRNVSSSIPMILVGNGLDLLKTGHRVVSSAEIEKLVEKYDLAGYFECSAKTGEGINRVFETAAKLVLENVTKLAGFHDTCSKLTR